MSSFGLQVSALIDEKILCMHGGLSLELNKLEQILNLNRPTDVPDTGLLCDLLWSDPSNEATGWAINDRAESLRPDFFAGEEVERLAMTELIEVISEENKSGPLIVLLKDVEKSFIGVTESLSSLRSKFNRFHLVFLL
ncbi:hypothetical protein ZEAMMB73_Zm00001d031932 [Zea mays]|uniref:Calcineurin-like phosphoesterase domain-containing protein n=1 Tax=Zea mays TaxID=4577 RepID=A0A1D6KME2_MAIZE|nr:hypothetical protein ZEAMMB73_Zm00001d031932 [Zea mays]